MDTAAIAELTHCEAIFASLIDVFLTRTRRNMSVPEQATEEVEQEFASLRGQLVTFFPEFRERFATLLIEQMGDEHVLEALSSLQSETAQRYLRAAPLVAAELERHKVRLSQPLIAAAENALASEQNDAW